MDSGTVFLVQLLAAAEGTNASASIDPTITINPSFTQASQFSVVASPGVFTTPEPPSVALFAIGLLALATVVGLTRFKRV